MSGGRFHLVTMQDGREFVSTIALSKEDAQGFLAMDTLLHRAAGWRVTEGHGVVVARRGDVVRLVSARRLDAPTDSSLSKDPQIRRVA
jgi:hypothetical protein